MNFNELEMSTDEIAEATGRTDRWVQQMAAKGYFERRRRGHYSTVSVLRGLSRFYDEQTKAKEVPSTRQRIDEAKAREVELRIEERLRHLIPQEEARMVMKMVVDAWEGELAQFHMRFQEPVRSALKKEISGSISRVQLAKTKLEKSLETGQPVEGQI